VATVCFGAFMGQLDASIVTLTYRPLAAEFHAGLAAVQWVSLAYLLVLIALLVPVGRISDVHGRKLVYVYGFVVFTVGSAACGLAPSLALLVAFRAVQAIGAAMLQSNGVALVRTSAPSSRLRAALGVQAGAQALGLALGPSLGGVIVTAVGWRWVFLVNIPIGLVALAAGTYLLPRTRDRSPAAAVDRPSVALLAVTTSTLLLGLSAAAGLALSGWVTVGLFALVAASGAGFAARQRRCTRPLVEPALMRDPALSWGLTGALCGYLVLFGPLVLVPIVLTAGGSSALGAGLALTALPAGFALAALAAGRLPGRALTERRRAAAGAGIAAAALAAGSFLQLSTATVVPLLAVIGIGLGVFTPANNTVIVRAVPARLAATAGGMLNLARGLGTALGVALVTLALHLGSSGREQVGGRLALLVLLGAAALATLSSLRSGNRGRRDRLVS
jgi:MFS family permease